MDNSNTHKVHVPSSTTMNGNGSNNNYFCPSDTRKPLKATLNNAQNAFLATDFASLDDDMCRKEQPTSSKKRHAPLAIKKMPPKRKKSSEKERQRNLEIKEALVVLGKSVPYVKKDLSRIRTLRLAKEYINHLRRILQGEVVTCDYSGSQRPLTMSDFERVVNQEMQTNNSYKDRADEELSTDGTSYNSPATTRDSPKSGSEKENREEGEVDMQRPDQSYPIHSLHSFWKVGKSRMDNDKTSNMCKGFYLSQEMCSQFGESNAPHPYDFQKDSNFY